MLGVAAGYFYSTGPGKLSVWKELPGDLGLQGDEHVPGIGCGLGAVLIAAACRLPRGRATGADIRRLRDQTGNSLSGGPHLPECRQRRPDKADTRALRGLPPVTGCQPRAVNARAATRPRITRPAPAHVPREPMVPGTPVRPPLRGAGRGRDCEAGRLWSEVSEMTDGRVVVGVDGSPSSVKALRWAVRYAELTGAEVEAVTAWKYPSTYGWAPVIGGETDFEGDAGQILAWALGQVTDAPDVLVCPSVIRGDAADVLIRAAKGADLLVVGSRGHGGFVGLLLGSVSQDCVHHAPCPVLVVRDP